MSDLLALLLTLFLVGESQTAQTTKDDKHILKVVGTLHDQNGQPVTDAKVKFLNINTSATDKVNVIDATWNEKTDKSGKYEVRLYLSGNGGVVLTRIAVEAQGFLRAEQQPKKVLNVGDTLTLDFKLSPGEVLAGTMLVPLRRGDQRKPEEVLHPFRVQGAGFRETYFTEKGGAFEIYVPPGVYSIKCSAFTSQPTTWTNLKTGSRDLVLRPEPFIYNSAMLGDRFDQLWEAVDHHYSYFAYKKDVDWKALKERYRPDAVKATNRKEFVAVLKDMLAHLKDLHVWIDAPEGQIGTFINRYRGNSNRAVTLANLQERVDCGFAIVGKTRDQGFGYFLMVNQGRADKASVAKATEAIAKLRDAPGFIVDLRQANGGDERLAAQLASLFCAKDTVYAKSKYRNGPGHDQFTKTYERILKSSPRPFTKPVVCLIGGGAVSSGEAFVQMMKCLPHVTTVGLPTSGASGNPQMFDLAGMDVDVWFSSWVDLMPDGSLFEGVGISPDVTVDLPPASYRDQDPTLQRGLEILRQKLSR